MPLPPKRMSSALGAWHHSQNDGILPSRARPTVGSLRPNHAALGHWLEFLHRRCRWPEVLFWEMMPRLPAAGSDLLPGTNQTMFPTRQA